MLTLWGQFAVAQKEKLKLDQAFENAGRQTDLMLSALRSETRGIDQKHFPRTIEHGVLITVRSSDWTSGFFPGQLWYLYEFTKDSKWRTLADSMTRLLSGEQFNGRTHDMGFKIYCSYGNGFRLTHQPLYRQVILQSAKTLATRFNPIVGCIRSWDHHRDQWQFPVIIDNMMNLELLFAATRLSGDSSFYRMAVSHADRTLENHFRADFSSAHVVDYDTLTGKVIQKNTHQGYSDGSAWARGQAWALYGYTMCYRETGDPRYLRQAQQIARFIFSHPRLPKDLIPYWDYDDPRIPLVSRDVSAAAITAAALYALSTYAPPQSGYRKTADRILARLATAYRAAPGTHKGFLLLHSTGNLPAGGEIDAPINYADYYYLEALLRSRN